ncbi:hypothetical protein [Ralstonia pseudosolanacearum]|uniref:hypothetical protein n=1 Tax=Ralstonia pseudosolanacearum TaxID=1310165 RepID=UPI003CF70007
MSCACRTTAICRGWTAWRISAACWCRLEKHLPTGALQSGQGCLCPRCLREAIARAGAARG